MRSATGSSRARRGRAGAGGAEGGFTLVEILLVFALFAVVSGLATASFAGLIRSAEERTPPEVFRAAVREARHLAFLGNRPVVLGYDEELHAFYLAGVNGGELPPSELEAGRLVLPGDTEVSFYRVTAEPQGVFGGSAGEVRFAANAQDRLVFHPSGAGTAARIVIRGSGEATVLTLEAFSSGPIPDPEER